MNHRNAESLLTGSLAISEYLEQTPGKTTRLKTGDKPEAKAQLAEWDRDQGNHEQDNSPNDKVDTKCEKARYRSYDLCLEFDAAWNLYPVASVQQEIYPLLCLNLVPFMHYAG